MTDIDIIKPVSDRQRLQITQATNDCVERAGIIFNRKFAEVPVAYDLQGKCAGMYQVRGVQRRIRYNPWIFAKYFEESSANTIVHEVAHYVVDCIWGIRQVKPHGSEWREIMVAMGAEPHATGSYDLTGIPTRHYKRYEYKCDCRTHQLTILRHRKIIERGASYRCQSCRSALVQDVFG